MRLAAPNGEVGREARQANGKRVSGSNRSSRTGRTRGHRGGIARQQETGAYPRLGCESYGGHLEFPSSPEDYARYSEVFPDAADRILTIAEKEQQLRADAQSRLLTNDSKKINGAIFLGFSLITLAGVAIWTGHEVIALPFGLAGTLTALIQSLARRQDRSRPGTR